MPHITMPKTEAGKNITRHNAITHGLTSRSSIVRNENPEDLETHRQRWHAEFPATTHVLFDLVTEAANSQWILFRTQRQYDLAAAKLFITDMVDWSAEQHADYTRYQRYLNTAKRHFTRDLTLVHQQSRHQQRATQQTEPEAQPEADHQPQTPPVPVKNDDMLMQHVFVDTTDGLMQTTFDTSNQRILEIGETRLEHTRIQRHIYFTNDIIPPHYAESFADLLPNRDQFGCLYYCLTLASFRLAVEREQPDGHLSRWPDLEALDTAALRNNNLDAKKL